MNLSDQVVSLELAKRLKEFGVKQDSLFYWHHYLINDWQIVIDEKCPIQSLTEKENYSAFTVAELINMLRDWEPYHIIIPCIENTANFLGNKLIELHEKSTKKN